MRRWLVVCISHVRDTQWRSSPASATAENLRSVADVRETLRGICVALVEAHVRLDVVRSLSGRIGDVACRIAKLDIKAVR